MGRTKTIKQEEPVEGKKAKSKSPTKKVKKEKQLKINECFKAEKRKPNRFDGFPEEELYSRCLPDHLAENLDILIVGINPGLFAAYKGHHYAGPGNHFWKCLYLSGLIPHPMTADDDFKLIQYGIGFTNMVQRTTRGSADLKPQEMKDGAKILVEKIRTYRPRIAVFNGKEIFRIFSGQKDFNFGKQPNVVDGTTTMMYVMPSSSARCSQLPRAVDKVPFYVALRKLRDHLRGELPYLTENEITFSSVLVTAPRKGDAESSKPVLEAGIVMKTELIDTDHDLDHGLDDNGRPVLTGRIGFNLAFVKKEAVDESEVGEDDERIEPASMARQGAAALVSEASGQRRTSTPATADLSDFFIDPVLGAAPPRSSRNVVNAAGIINCPASTSAQESDHVREGSGENGAGYDADNDQKTEQKPESAGSSSSGQPTTEQHSESNLASFAPAFQSQIPPTIPYRGSGDELWSGAQTPQSCDDAMVQSQTPTTPTQPAQIGHRLSGNNLLPEITQHIEDSIESVVQRARIGPLEMPAFRAQPEKPAPKQRGQQQVQVQQQKQQVQQQQPIQPQPQYQQQQQHHQQQSQQMFTNLQPASFGTAHAAHFDLNSPMKPATPTLNAYGNVGGGPMNQQPNNGAPPGIYQYFQASQQQLQQASQGGFHGSAFTGPASTAPNYGNWSMAPTGYDVSGQQSTTNPNQGGGQTVYSQSMAPQYFQNPSSFVTYNTTAQSYGNFPATSPYFAPQQQQMQPQQPGSNAMYGQYAGQFLTDMAQQQQQNSHNL